MSRGEMREAHELRRVIALQEACGSERSPVGFIGRSEAIPFCR
jgi:hypothetical protein